MKRAIRIGAIVVGIIIVILIALPFLVDVNAFRPKLESELTSALGRQVTVGNLSLSLLSGSVSADNISIGDDPAFSKNPFVTAKSLKVGVEVMPLIFSKTLHVTGITLEEPQITLLRGANDTWNFSSLGKNTAAAEKPQPAKPAEASSSAPPANQPPKTGEPSGSAPANQPAKSGETLSVDKLSVSNGRLLVGTANSSAKPTVYDKVNIDVTDFSATTQSPFTVTAEAPGGGDLSLKGKFGPINAADAAATPFDGTLAARKLNLATSGFVEPSTGIQGIADFDGTINSNGQEAKTTGTAKVDKLKLVEKGSPSPKEVQVKYGTTYNLKSDSGTLSQGDVSIGQAVAHLTGGYQTHGQTTTLNMKLDGNEMPVDELEAFLPAVGVVLPPGSQLRGGTLSANLGITGTTDKPVITGPIRLSNSKLAGFDLGSKLSAVSALSGKSTGGKDTSIQNFSTTVHAAPDGTQANDINLTIPALGVVTGAGTVSPSGALNFHMNANVSGGAVGGAIQQTALGSHTGNGVPFTIEGTTSDPKFVPDVKAMAGSAVQQAVSGKVGATKGTGGLGGMFGKKKH